MYEFNWEGKELAYKLAQTPSTGTLIPDKESSKNWDDTENLYIEGDNLEVLKLLQKNYFGKVKMIYIDPPYNTGNDFVYKDNFKDNIDNYKEITSQTTRVNPETNGRYHTDWLNMMYPRLKLARNLLREEGVIFISIDDNEVNNLKKMCDEIFGESNFIANIIWQSATDNNPRQISIEHEYIMCYCKSLENQGKWLIESSKAKLIESKYLELKGKYNDINDIQSELKIWIKNNESSLKGVSHYSYVDNIGVYYPGNSSNTKPGGYMFDIIHPITKKICKKPEFGYRWPEKTFLQAAKRGDVDWGNDENTIPKIKKRIDTVTEMLKSYYYEDNRYWTKYMTNLMGKKVFENPKSVYLLERLIKFTTGPDSIVLDFFSGSSSTADAIMNINLQDNSECKFIMVQLPELTDEKSEAYKAGYKNICEIGKERIRRAGDKIVSENKDKEGIEDLDIGFKVFKLDYNKGGNKMYNAKLIELSNKTNIMYRGHQIYELKDVYFYVLQTEEEYIQWKYKNDIFWNMEHSEEFYNRLMNPMKIEILTNKKPKELKGKKKIATINKDADYKVQVFIDDDYNLYYQDNHAFASCESKIVDNKVETTWNSCKCWFKIIGLYECRNNHIVDILRDLNSYSEYLYPKNNVADNAMLSRLYEQMVNVYLDYVNN